MATSLKVSSRTIFFSDSFTSTTPPNATVNVDGTTIGTDAFGTPVYAVRTALGRDFFTYHSFPTSSGIASSIRASSSTIATEAIRTDLATASLE